ncbi:MAG: adenylate/guanylate cyclase domain-containing protein [Rhizobiaceae bacterium]|nr:adenylate/guanylate cyclase domain-containing protein [Rhizobiaceae bacterium]
MADELDERPASPVGQKSQAPRKYAPGVSLLSRRTFELDLQSKISVEEIERWLLTAASKTKSAHVLTESFACRLARAGLGVDRLVLNVGTFHPQANGYAWAWNILDRICDEIQISEETLFSDAFRNNPIYRVITFGENVREKLRDKASKSLSPLMAELAAAGFSDYIAIPLSTSGERRNAVTLATRQAGGFSQAQIETLMQLLELFALHVERHVIRRIAKNISYTYLGRAAGKRVVTGTVKRGSGLSISAIVWSSDMRNFSKLSEHYDNQTMVDVLNRYFSVLAESVIRHGGDVLKFMGDGMLAVFPIADFASANAAAHAAANAAEGAVQDLERLNQEKTNVADWRPLKTGIGLHLGNVFFGNIGSTGRLDFTVVGEAVNLASRIEGFCKTLERDVLMSASVASLLGDGVESLGEQTLKGLQNPEELFALSGKG